MSSVQDGLESQIRNIESKYGKSLSDWMQIIREASLTKHPEVVAMLKNKYGLTHGHAHRLSLIYRGSDAASVNAAAAQTGTDPIDALLGPKKASARKLYDLMMRHVAELGDDIEVAHKTHYVSLRRKKQFAMLQRSASGLDIALILPGVKASKRLESAKSFNALFTHRVRLTESRDIDRELRIWLTQAYENAR